MFFKITEGGREALKYCSYELRVITICREGQFYGWNLSFGVSNSKKDLILNLCTLPLLELENFFGLISSAPGTVLQLYLSVAVVIPLGLKTQHTCT